MRHLQLTSADTVFAITSAGDNILHYAINATPARIHAVDMNPWYFFSHFLIIFSIDSGFFQPRSPSRAQARSDQSSYIRRLLRSLRFWPALRLPPTPRFQTLTLPLQCCLSILACQLRLIPPFFVVLPSRILRMGLKDC